MKYFEIPKPPAWIVISRQNALIGAMLLFSLTTLNATVINARTGSFADINAAVNAAKDGDVVQMPPGTTTWSSSLLITKAITLQGAGIDQTVIIDELSRSAQYDQLFRVSISTNQNFRLSGFTIRGGTTNTTVNWDGNIALGGTSRSFRVDHIKLDGPFALGIYVSGWLYGVIDHCIFNMSHSTQAILVKHRNWGGYSYGDGSWAEGSYWGSEKAVYMEDNTFLDGNYAGAIDSFAGARLVFRYNVVSNTFLVNHGTDNGARDRSCRSMEIYGNSFYWSPDVRNAPWVWAIYSRGGSAVVFSNSISGAYANMMILANYRSTANPEGFPWPPWGACSNTIPNITGPSVYDGNTDQYGYPAIDQVGRGAGILLSGDTTPIPGAWPQQVLEPVYQWSNTVASGIRDTIASQQPIIQANRDWYDFTPKPGYKPYTYPHPLITGVVRPPPPPNFRVMAGP